MNIKKYFTIRHLILTVIGGVVGYIYYRFWGCANQTCPITSNPYLTILYGMLFGYLLTPNKKSSKKSKDETNFSNKNSGLIK